MLGLFGDICNNVGFHLQIWCVIASIALQVRAFELCSNAFIKLEALEVGELIRLSYSACSYTSSGSIRLEKNYTVGGYLLPISSVWLKC